MDNFQVLYAEDEFTNRKLLEIQLTKNGITIDTASDGLQALYKIKVNHYDLVILDHYMPGMNGDVLAAEIRKTKPDLPLLAITSDDSYTDMLLNAGFAEVFIKPLRGTDYIETIRKYLPVKE